MGKKYRIHQELWSSEWKYGHPSSTWARRLGLKRNKGTKDFSKGFQEEFKDVILNPPAEPLGKRWQIGNEKNGDNPHRRLPEGARTFVDETLQKYELYPDYDFLHRIALAASVVGVDHYKELNSQMRNFVEFTLYHAITTGKPVDLRTLLQRFHQLPGESATDRILQERELEHQLEHQLFGVDGAQSFDTEKEVQRFNEYVEYLADRYAFTGADVTELIEAGRYGATRAIMKFGIDGDSPEYRGLVFSHINWYIQQAANLSPEQRMRTPNTHELIQGYEEKEAYERKLLEEEKERQHEIRGKQNTFNRFVRRFLNQKEYRGIEENIRQARESLDEDSDPLVVAVNLLRENVPRYKDKNVWDFRFKDHWPEELKKLTLEKLRYILEEERGIPVDEVPRRVNTYLVDDLGFKNFRIAVYKGATIDLINDLYPSRFKPWEFVGGMGVKGGRRGIWSRGGVELFNEATRWLVEEKLKIPVEEAPEKLNVNVFEQYHLGNALNRFFEGSPLHALAAAYPDQFTPEDFVQVIKKRLEIVVNNEILTGVIGRYERFMWNYSRRYFQGLTDKAQPLLRHLIDIDDLVQAGRNAIWDALKQHPEISLENAGSYHPLIVRYITNKIKGTVRQVYETNDVLALSDSLNRLVYTHGQTNSKRTLEEVVGDSDEPVEVSEDGEPAALGETIGEGKREYLYPVFESLGRKVNRFKKFMQDTLTEEESKSMGNYIEEAATQLETRYIWHRADFDPIDEGMRILETIPRFKGIQKWQVKSFPWGGHGGTGKGGVGQKAAPYERWKGRELAKAATRWLFEAKLGVSVDKIPRVASTRIFNEYGLWGMVNTVYDGSVWAAVEDAYPGRWKPWEFKNAPHLWDKGALSYRIAAAATRWLVEEKLRTTPERVKRADLYNNGLAGMLVQLFHGNFRPALRNAYPEIYDPSKIGQLRSFLRQNLPRGIYSLMPENVILNNIPKKAGWDPVDAGIQIMARLDPEYANKPIWQFRYNNRPDQKYSTELVAHAVSEAVGNQNLKPEELKAVVTRDWITQHGFEEPIKELYGRVDDTEIDWLIEDVIRRQERYRRQNVTPTSAYTPQKKSEEDSEERVREAVERLFGVILPEKGPTQTEYEPNKNVKPVEVTTQSTPERGDGQNDYKGASQSLDSSELAYYRGFLNMLGLGRRIRVPYNGFKPELIEKAVLEIAGNMGKRITTQPADNGLYVSLR